MKNAKISRRSFLLGLAACSAAGILTACKGMTPRQQRFHLAGSTRFFRERA